MISKIKNFSNGLRVAASPLKERKSVSIGIWVHVGARNEETSESGVSHFLEHLVFKGTKKRTANQIKESVEGIGGSLNAFTSEECTCFLAKTTRRHFEQVFDTLSDMTLSASLADADIEKERTVVIEEIKMTQDQPSQLADELLSEIVWPGHDLGRPIAGTVESVTGLSPAMIRNYRDRYYQPDLITVTAAGDIEPEDLFAAAQAAFSGSKTNPQKKLVPFKNLQNKPAIRLFEKDTEQAQIALSLHAFPKNHPDEYTADVLSVILGGNMSSRLFNEVREEKGLAYDIGSFVRRYQEAGAFSVAAGVDPKKSIEALSLILSELEKIAGEPVLADELRRAKDFYLGQFELSLENSMNQMLWAGESLMTLGQIKTPEEVALRIEAVTREDILRVSKEIFQTKHLNLAVVGPSLAASDFEKVFSFKKL